MDRLTRDLAECTVQIGADEKAGPGNAFLPAGVPLAELAFLSPEEEARQVALKKSREREFAERLNHYYPV